MAQLAQFGDMGLVNELAGLTVPAVQGSAPTWTPGMYWVNTSAGNTINQWQNATGGWQSSPAAGTRFLALLTADPVLGAAVNISDPGFSEMVTAGYSRQIAAFSQSTATYPASSANTNLITFGPMTNSMLVPVQWVALVTIGSTSSTQGFFLASWNLVAPIQVNASQSIQIGIGQLVLQGQ
jgi:hypothetical protein